jgi:hypothetical protein
MSQSHYADRSGPPESLPRPEFQTSTGRWYAFFCDCFRRFLSWVSRALRLRGAPPAVWLLVPLLPVFRYTITPGETENRFANSACGCVCVCVCVCT